MAPLTQQVGLQEGHNVQHTVEPHPTIEGAHTVAPFPAHDPPFYASRRRAEGAAIRKNLKLDRKESP